MGTPAVNLDVQTTVQGTVTNQETYNGNPVGSPTTVPSGSYRSERTQRIRPASNGVPVSNGWRACSPWSHKGMTFHRSPDVAKVRQKIGTNRYIESQFDGGFWEDFVPGDLPVDYSNAVNRAEVMALNNLRNQDIHLGEFLATGRQTINMVGSRAQLIARSVRNWRRYHPRRLWNRVRRYEGSSSRADRSKIPASWLELQYGWIPLLQDIFGLLGLLDSLGNEPSRINVKGHAKSDLEVRVPVESGGLANAGKAEFITVGEHKVDISLWYTLADRQMAQLSSLGLINPAEIVWECLPYSFVVDWFLPIGPWMQALTADVGWNFTSGSLSILSKGTFKSEVRSLADNDFMVTHALRPQVSGKQFRFSRSCYASSPVPGLYVKNPLSLRHTLNAIALLSQAFR